MLFALIYKHLFIVGLTDLLESCLYM